jgi:leucyl/phenylalanyl-tRNA--protein transferase
VAISLCHFDDTKMSVELTPPLLLTAYASGCFPMADSRSGEILWYAPDPRAILPLDEFRVSRSLRRTVASGSFDVRFDTAFETVIRACADRPETWISGDIVRAFVELNRLGFAHSVEAWSDGQLVGGLYGVAIGGAFFGESMFHRKTNASKVVLVYLVEHLRARGFQLLDTQFATDHLERFGVREISREDYEIRLKHAIGLHVSW